MIPFFPKTIANKGLSLYIISLTVVSVAFMSYAMDVVWMVLGLLEVAAFFMFSTSFSQQWQQMPSKLFAKKLFWTSLLLRVVWVVFSYFFYIYQTGIPFEFGAADSAGYHADAEWLSNSPWKTV